MIIIIMGVEGVGKTTVGRMLAASLQWHFAEGDDFHTPANIAKMSAGIPLNDADRAPWLAALRQAILDWIARRENVVLACSALKRCYRDLLRVGPEVRFVYLRGSLALIKQRLDSRQGHFAKASLLPSQFEDLEEPEDALICDASLTPAELVDKIRSSLGLNATAR